MFEGYTVQVGHDAGDKDHGGRSPEQCMNRFQKSMKPDLLLFNQYFKQLENEEPSGVPYKDLVKIAHKRYNAQTKKEPFRFIQCVPTLHKILKFQPFACTRLTAGLISAVVVVYRYSKLYYTN